MRRACNRKLAKRLKELGEPQDSLWWWMPMSNGIFEITSKENIEGFKSLKWFKNIVVYSAPTVAELGERLPVGCKSWLMHGEPIYVNGDHITGHWTGGYKRGKWICTYKEKKCEAKTEADVRAKMLIYLLENKLIEEG